MTAAALLRPEDSSRLWRVMPDSFAVKLSERSWLPAPHHRLLAYLLYLCRIGAIKRLIVSLPPGAGKSELTSHWFPSWAIEMDPRVKIILASYEATLAEEWGKSVRAVFQENHDLLGTRLRTDSQAANRWRTTRQGGMWTTGSNGTITGRRAGIMVIDDPHKNFAEAHSQTIRDGIWNWYTSTARTRMLPGGAIIVVQCLAGDQRVQMADGTWRRIDAVAKGDKVMALGDGVQARSVLGARCSGEDDTYRVTTPRLTLTANARHPILAVKRAEVVRPALETEWRQVGDLEVGDLVLCPTETPGKAPCPVKGWNTPERAWLLGFLFGDGWVTKWSRKNWDAKRNKHYESTSWAVCAAIGVDDDENERVAAALTEAFGRRPRATAARYWRLDHNAAGRTLDALGLHPKVGALKKRIPDWIFGQSTDVQRAFLRGLLDADGSKPKTGHSWVLGSANPDLVEDARLLALGCGVRPTTLRSYPLTRQPPNSPAPVTTRHVTAGFVFPEDDRRGRTLVTGDLPAGFRIDRITSIEPAGRQKVYDLAVDGENFLAEGFIVHNTRWHEDDLSGRLIERAREGAQDWVVLRLPAVAEQDETIESVIGEATVARLRSLNIPVPPWFRAEGQALWPTLTLADGSVIPWYDLDELTDIRAEVGEYVWNGLYQQNPTSPTGSFFPVDKWGFVDELPSRVRLVRRWDLAATEGGGDWTAGGLVAYDDKTRSTFIVDMVRERLSSSKVKALVKLTAELDKAKYGRRVEIVLEQEPGSSGKTVAEDMVSDTLQGFPARFEPTTGDKELNALPLSAQQQVGNVYLVRKPHPDGGYVAADWWPELIEEGRAFPHGTHDDQIDTISHGYNDLMKSKRKKSPAQLRGPASGSDTPRERPPRPGTSGGGAYMP